MAPKSGGKEGTTIDGLKQVYQQVANLALASDAGKYMPIINALQQAVLQLVNKVTQQEIQQANASAMGGMPSGGMGGPPNPAQMGSMGGPSMASPPGGPPPAQGSPGIASPNSDELRRALAMQAAG